MATKVLTNDCMTCESLGLQHFDCTWGKSRKRKRFIILRPHKDYTKRKCHLKYQKVAHPQDELERIRLFYKYNLLKGWWSFVKISIPVKFKLFKAWMKGERNAPSLRLPT